MNSPSFPFRRLPESAVKCEQCGEADATVIVERRIDYSEPVTVEGAILLTCMPCAQTIVNKPVPEYTHNCPNCGCYMPIN